MGIVDSSSTTTVVGVSVVKQLHREIQALIKTPLDGIQVIPNESDIMSLEAIIEGPEHTPFHGGSFKIRLVFDDAYPKVPPKGLFTTPIFHPNVSPSSGDICVNTLQKDWNPTLGLSHLLLTIKCLLMLPNAESALNEEAGRLLLEDPEGYERKASMMTRVHAVTTDHIIPPTAPPKRPLTDQNCQSNDCAEQTRRTTPALKNSDSEHSSGGSALAAMRKKLKRL